MAQVTISTLQERDKILSAFLVRVGCRMLVTHTTSAIWKDQRPLIFRRKPLCSRDMCLLNHPAARWHSPTHFRDCWAYSKNASRHLPTRIFLANVIFLWGKWPWNFPCCWPEGEIQTRASCLQIFIETWSDVFEARFSISSRSVYRHSCQGQQGHDNRLSNAIKTYHDSIWFMKAVWSKLLEKKSH